MDVICKMGEEETGITWLMYSFPANSLLPLTTSRTNSGNVKWKEASLLEELWNLFHTLEGRLLHCLGEKKKVGSILVEKKLRKYPPAAESV